MKNNKYRELEKKQEQMIEWAGASEESLREKMERVRLQNNFTRMEFSELLGYNKYTYSSMACYRKTKMTANLLLRFCYMFGYDITQAVTYASESELDKSTYELAAIISSFPPDAIRSLADGMDIILPHLAEERGLPVAPYRRLSIALRELVESLKKQDE